MSLIINPVLCRKGTMNNYAYIIVDNHTQKTAVIDASEAHPVIEKLETLHLKPEYILTTHHHFDHVGGNQKLKDMFQAKIIAPDLEKDKIEGVDITLSDGESFTLGQTTFMAIAAPGHTMGHMLYYVPDDKVLFTGDVLFNLSIGGLFEGTPQQMWQTLQKIKQLPDDVDFYPGHEYTQHSLAQIARNGSQPAQIYLQLAISRLQQGLPVAPVKLGLEKQCNPYLLIDNQAQFEKIF